MTIKDKEVPTPFDEPLHSSPFPLTIERNGEETKEEDYTTTIRIRISNEHMKLKKISLVILVKDVALGHVLMGGVLHPGRTLSPFT